ncbi:MAG: hypothetical protein Rpha_1077 [Candidatus Ruthia sp. Apha_13_S6]|nr:hypothetical protein [Candidatus Ruthia sp. Apha_13_S6]
MVKQNSAAFKYTLKSLNHDFNNVYTLQMLGVVSLQIGKIEMAIQMFNCALKLKPNFDKNLLLLATPGLYTE